MKSLYKKYALKEGVPHILFLEAAE
jgi:hypothetical protein